MRDISEVPQPSKKYRVSNSELKDALGIDWPGSILYVDRDYMSGSFTVVMSVRPDELTGEDRERLTTDAAVRVPVKLPNPPKRKWWQK
jgi:hypothetical protein